MLDSFSIYHVLIYITVSLKEAFGQKDVPHHKKRQMEVHRISVHDPWKSQPWPAVFIVPSRGQDGWRRFPLSLQQRQILLTDRSTFIFIKNIII